MTNAEYQSLQLIARALRPTALHVGPIPAQMGSDALADLASAVLILDRPLSMAMLERIVALSETLRAEITA